MGPDCAGINCIVLRSQGNTSPLSAFLVPPAFPMARDEVDPSLIVTQPRKRRLASYATNEDNISADKAATIKRLKKTINQNESQTSIITNDGASTHSQNQSESSGDDEVTELTASSLHHQKAHKLGEASEIVETDEGDALDIQMTEAPKAPKEDAEQELGMLV